MGTTSADQALAEPQGAPSRRGRRPPLRGRLARPLTRRRGGLVGRALLAWLLASLVVVALIARPSAAAAAAPSPPPLPAASSSCIPGSGVTVVVIAVVERVDEATPALEPPAVLAANRVGDSSLRRLTRVGPGAAQPADRAGENRLQLRRSAVGVTVYVNGDPVNLVDPNGHNPCSYEGTGPGGCPHDVNWAQASQSAPGAGASSGSGGSSGPPTTQAQSHTRAQFWGGYYRWFNAIGGFHPCDTSCQLQRAEQDVIDHWSQGGGVTDLFKGIGETGVALLEGVKSNAQCLMDVKQGPAVLTCSVRPFMNIAEHPLDTIQAFGEQSQCGTGNIAHCAGYALGTIGTAIAAKSLPGALGARAGAAATEATPALAGVGPGAASVADPAFAGGTTLFRAVEPGELGDISASGAYRVPEGIGNGKYFYPTQEQAANFARMNPARSYTLTSGQFPDEVIGGSWSGSIAGEGNAFFISGEHFPFGPVAIGGPLP